MNILMINGSPNPKGFTADALEIVASYLNHKGSEVHQIRLADANIQDCLGCFHCLRTGKCVLKDDMEQIVPQMLDADGFVVGASVRNGLTTACYKRFYERITYRLGFPLLLEEKYTLGISNVGLMGGKSVCKRLVGLQDVCHTRLSDFIFGAVGIPIKAHPEKIREKLERAAERLIENIAARRPKGAFDRLFAAVDRMILARFMFKKSPEVYAYVIECWKKKKYLS